MSVEQLVVDLVLRPLHSFHGALEISSAMRIVEENITCTGEDYFTRPHRTLVDTILGNLVADISLLTIAHRLNYFVFVLLESSFGDSGSDSQCCNSASRNLVCCDDTSDCTDTNRNRWNIVLPHKPDFVPRAYYFTSRNRSDLEIIISSSSHSLLSFLTHHRRVVGCNDLSCFERSTTSQICGCHSTADAQPG